MQAPRHAVVFDVGCTLIHPSTKVLAAMLRERGVGSAITDRDIAAAFRYACEANLRRLPSGPSNVRQGAAFLGALGIPSSADEAAAFWHEVDVRGGAGALLYDRIDESAVATLTQLREDGHVVVAASNSDGTLDAELASFGLDVLFDRTFDSSDMGIEKPGSGFFRIVLDALAERGDVGETWYVGDDPIRDVVGSLGSGFDRAVLYDPFTLYGLIDSGFRIDRLDRLPALVTGAGS
ncbi:HAD family hydrolase [Kocuria salsicia]|uniref:HAD family hydrolase n=1 Tax=Kocuria salsicia TaxID=664639 RepID=UPI0011A49B1D|nr:HAD family hydrolase [Kocuria salsicia]